MLNLIKMIFYRILKNKIYFLMAVFIPPLVVIASLFFTNNVENKIRVGVINFTKDIEIENINVIKLTEEPPISELVQGKYDALIIGNETGYEVKSIKGQEYEKLLKQIIDGKTPLKELFISIENRGVISSQIGFLTMLLMLMGSMLYKFYYEDKKGTDKRILYGTVSYKQYILSHILVVFLILFIPTILICILANIIFSLNIYVSVTEITFIIFTLCLLSTSFSFFIASITKTEENGSLLATMAIVITSLISGSIIEVSKQGLTQKLAHLFPQRYIIDFSIQVERGEAASNISMFVIIFISILLLTIGGIINKKRIQS